MAKLKAADAIALTFIVDSLKTGSFSTGAKSRDVVIERLDGHIVGGDTYNIDKAVMVRVYDLSDGNSNPA